MKLIANDTVRISSAGGRLEAGQEFEVSDHEAKELLRRGIARASGEAPQPKRRTKKGN